MSDGAITEESKRFRIETGRITRRVVSPEEERPMTGFLVST
jgi:hypothetical protein